MGIYDIHYLHKSLEGFELKMISCTIFHYNYFNDSKIKM